MTTTTQPPGEAPVIGPGVHDLPVDVYHADPVPGGSLSSTGARKLIPPSCPALYRHWRENPEEHKPAWDKGKAAHKVVLGAGPGLVPVVDEWGKDPNAWRTNEVKARLAEIRQRGDIPLKQADYDEVHAMADAIRAHPEAAALLDPAAGVPEQTLIWRDEQTGVMCRALVDFLRYPVPGRRLLLPDYKHTGAEYGASPEKIGRTMGDFGYHVQLAWYLMGVRALGLAGDDAEALMIVQESRRPYLVTVAQPNPAAMRMGSIRCRQALDLYAECTASGRWPGYSDEVVWAELPPWQTKELDGVIL